MRILFQHYSAPEALLKPNPAAGGSQQAPIHLQVDFREGTIDILHRDTEFFGTSMEVWRGDQRLFRLPDNVDATRLHEFVEQRIEPLLRQLAAAFSPEEEMKFPAPPGSLEQRPGEWSGGILLQTQRLCDQAPVADVALLEASQWVEQAGLEAVDHMSTDLDLQHLAEELEEMARTEHVVLEGDIFGCLKDQRDSIRENSSARGLLRYIQSQVGGELLTSRRGVPHLVLNHYYSICWFGKGRFFRTFTGYLTSDNQQYMDFKDTDDLIGHFRNVLEIGPQGTDGAGDANVAPS